MTYPPVKLKTRCPSLGHLLRSFRRVKKDAPVVLEILIAMTILCALLIIDVLWLGATHRKEINMIMAEHSHDVGKFRKQFDAQIHQVNEQNDKKGQEFLQKHVEDVNKIKVLHHIELESKINGIQKELNSLLGLSKTYWDKHDLEIGHIHDQENNEDNNPLLNNHNDQLNANNDPLQRNPGNDYN